MVKLYRFATTPEEEERIAQRIENLGASAIMGCAIFTAEAIRGVGPFKDLRTVRTPASLGNALEGICKQNQCKREVIVGE